MIISFKSKYLKYCFYAFTLSLINPVVIAINFIFLFEKLATTKNQSMASMPINLVPVWLAAGMGTCVAISLILFFILRATAKLSFTQFTSINMLAHLPFIPFSLFSWLLITTGIEWNIGGLILVPLFILMAVVLIPVSFFIAVVAIRKVRRQRATIAL